jgi:DNA-binding NarL/FixJ family response regulator
LILQPLADIDIVAEAANGREAVVSTVRLRPQVVLLDIRMPVMDGLAALREDSPRTRLDGHHPDDVRRGRIRRRSTAAGAAGFLLKESAVDELARAIRAAASGEAFLTPAITRQLLDRLPTAVRPESADATQKLAVLSEREREALILITQGSSNLAISEQLWITERTVKTHVSRIFTKRD